MDKSNIYKQCAECFQIRSLIPHEYMYFLYFFIANTCGSDQFQCTSGICKYTNNDNCDGQCIRGDWFQDGEEDCSDGSDEGKWLL